MSSPGRYGVIMVNTGSPEAPTPRAVRTYLSKFLSHPRIAPMNRFVWWFILHLAILPRRSEVSAQKYASIWTEEGSPFTSAHESLCLGVQKELSSRGYAASVKLAMSFSEPKLSAVVRGLRKEGCSSIVVLPLYPQSAFSTTGVVQDDLNKALRRTRWKDRCTFVDDYHAHQTYLRAVAASIVHAGFNPEGDDRLVFSFHSIPLTDIENGDVYELQTSSTSLAIAQELGLARERWTIAYQCRFDKSRDWLAPNTSEVLKRMAQVGGGRVFVVCPNFAVDCLETLYDIVEVQGPAYLQNRRAAGHPTDTSHFVYVPCLGSTKAHAQVLCDVLEPHLS